MRIGDTPGDTPGVDLTGLPSQVAKFDEAGIHTAVQALGPAGLKTASTVLRDVNGTQFHDLLLHLFEATPILTLLLGTNPQQLAQAITTALGPVASIEATVVSITNAFLALFHF